ncbi:Uncharacterised protein [uncultured archaeon]|nr:Uncharacterised protein [uncultured archaeon]
MRKKINLDMFLYLEQSHIGNLFVGLVRLIVILLILFPMPTLTTGLCLSNRTKDKYKMDSLKELERMEKERMEDLKKSLASSFSIKEQTLYLSGWTDGYLRAQNRITEMISSVKEIQHD